MIKAAGGARIGHKNLCLCSAIRLWEVARGHAMSYSLDTEESLCTTCTEFWATITGKLFRYTKRGEEGKVAVNEAGSARDGRACWRSKNLDPAGEAITHHEVMAAVKGEEVSIDGGMAGRGGMAAVSHVADICGHAWPVNYGPGMLCHH